MESLFLFQSFCVDLPFRTPQTLKKIKSVRPMLAIFFPNHPVPFVPQKKTQYPFHGPLLSVAKKREIRK